MSDYGVKFGDLVAVKRTDPVKFWHYGVYIDNDELIHLSGAEFDLASKPTANVHRVTWKDFIGDSVEFKPLPCKPNVNREEVVTRAKSEEGRLFRGRQYHLAFNNCEHFARWCQTGKALSLDVLKGIALAEFLVIESIYIAQFTAPYYAVYIPCAAATVFGIPVALAGVICLGTCAIVLGVHFSGSRSAKKPKSS